MERVEDNQTKKKKWKIGRIREKDRMKKYSTLNV